MTETPILDNHLHLDPVNGRGAAATDEFVAVGGTHLLVLNKPSWALTAAAGDPEGFRETFEITCDVADAAAARLPGTAWPVLGVHPALISRLVEAGDTPAEAADRMRTGLDIAAGNSAVSSSYTPRAASRSNRLRPGPRSAVCSANRWSNTTPAGR